MDFISVRDLKINTGKVWEKLSKEKDLVITSNGRPLALMTGIAGNNLESMLAAIRRARGEWAIRQLRKDAQARGLTKISSQEIDREIKKTRQTPRR